MAVIRDVMPAPLYRPARLRTRKSFSRGVDTKPGSWLAASPLIGSKIESEAQGTG